MEKRTKIILAVVVIVIIILAIWQPWKKNGTSNGSGSDTGTGSGNRMYRSGGAVPGEGVPPRPVVSKHLIQPIIQPKIWCRHNVSSPGPTWSATQPVCEPFDPLNPNSPLVSSTPVPANSGGNSGFVAGSLATKCCYKTS